MNAEQVNKAFTAFVLRKPINGWRIIALDATREGEHFEVILRLVGVGTGEGESTGRTNQDAGG